MKRAIPEKSGAHRYLSILLLIESASIIGLFSTHRFPHFVRIVGNDLHTAITQTTDAASVIIAVALVLIARGIAHKRKRAWQLATSLQSLLIVMALFHNVHRLLSHHHATHILFGNFGLTHLIFELIVLVLLIIKRKSFDTVTDPHTRKSDLFYFLKVTGLSFLASTIIIFLTGTDLSTSYQHGRYLKRRRKGLLESRAQLHIRW